MADPPRAHEESDVSIRAISGLAAGLLAVIALIAVGTNLVTRWVAAHPDSDAPKPSPLYRPAPLPEPRLQVSPPQEMREFRAREERILTSYGWTDKATGVVRIPIEAAKKRILEKGLPARPAEGR